MDTVEHSDDRKLETIHESDEVPEKVVSHVLDKIVKSTVADKEHDNLQPDLEESMESSTSSQAPHRLKLGNVKPPSRSLHKNIPGSVSATASKLDDKKDRALIPSLGPLMGQHMKSSESSPLSTDRRSEPSPRQLPGSNMSSPSQVHMKGGFLKTESLSPNSSFSLGGKLTAPPLGEIVTPVSKASRSSRPSPSTAESDEKEWYTNTPTTHSPTGTGSGISPPRNLTPLGPVGLKPLSAAPRHTKLAPIRSTSLDAQTTSPNREPVLLVGDELEHSLDLDHSLDPHSLTTNPTNNQPDQPVVHTTDDPTAPTTDDPTASTTDDPTAPTTDDPTAPTTNDPTASNTDDPTAPTTDDPTASNTDDPTASNTDDPTAPTTDDPTAPTTNDPTASTTDDPTAPITNDPTASTTDDPTALSADPHTIPTTINSNQTFIQGTVVAGDAVTQEDIDIHIDNANTQQQKQNNVVLPPQKQDVSIINTEIGESEITSVVPAHTLEQEQDEGEKTTTVHIPIEPTVVPPVHHTTTVAVANNNAVVTSGISTSPSTTTADKAPDTGGAEGVIVPLSDFTADTTVADKAETRETTILLEADNAATTATTGTEGLVDAPLAASSTATTQPTTSPEPAAEAPDVTVVVFPPPNTPVRNHLSGTEKITELTTPHVATISPLNISTIKQKQHEVQLSPRTPKTGGTTPISRHGSYSSSTSLLKGRSTLPLTHTTNIKHSPRDSGNSQSISSRDLGNSQSVATQEYELSYNRIVSDLRTTLLQLDNDISNIKTVVRNIFKRLNVNEHGELTVQELKNFILSPELNLFSLHDPRAEKYATMLMEQIDINNDGSISLLELETFLYPIIDINLQNENIKEIGMVIDFTRTAVRYYVSKVAALGSDEAILEEFAKLAKTTLKRNTLESRYVKKAFLNIKIPEFGRYLNKIEVDQLYNTIDCNDDGVVSALEFKYWLFPSYKKGNAENIALYLRNIVLERFHGDIGNMFRSFCTGSDGMLYKADFVTALKAIDSAISRHEGLGLATAIAGSDKTITIAHLQAAMGVSIGRTVLGSGETASVAWSESVDLPEASTATSTSFTSPRSKRRQRREQAANSGTDSNMHSSLHSEGQFSEGVGERIDVMPHTPNRRSRAQSGTGQSLLHAEDDSNCHDQTEPANVHSADALGGSEESDDDAYSVQHLSDASELSFDSAIDQAGEKGLPAQDGRNGTALDRSVAAVRVDLQAPQSVDPLVLSSEPTEKEKEAVWELLYGTPHTSPTKDSRTDEQQQASSLPLTECSDKATVVGHPALSVPRGESPRKTVGLLAPELLALGYSQHTGRWRGFPYDNWSCCETNALECPYPKDTRSLSSRRIRNSSTSPGTSPNKSRLSIESLNSSLYQPPKSPPFIPAGRPLYSTSTTASLELGRTRSPTLRDSGNREGFSTRRSAIISTTTSTATTTSSAKKTKAGSTRQTSAISGQGPSKSFSSTDTAKPTIQQVPEISHTTSKKRVDSNSRGSSSVKASSTSNSRPYKSTVQGAVSSRSSYSTASPPIRRSRISTTTAPAAASIPTRTSSTSNDISSIVVHGSSVPTTFTRLRRPAAQTTTTTKQTPSATTSTASTETAAKHSTGDASHPPEHSSSTPFAVPHDQPGPISNSLANAASAHSSSSSSITNTSEAPQPQQPEESKVVLVMNPVVAMNSAESGTTTIAAADVVPSPSLTMKFTVDIPARQPHLNQQQYEVVLPPHATELLGRLYAPVPVVEAQKAKLHSPTAFSRKALTASGSVGSDDCYLATDISTPAPLALRATKELQSVVSLESAGQQYTSPALEKAWSTLCESMQATAQLPLTTDPQRVSATHKSFDLNRIAPSCQEKNTTHNAEHQTPAEHILNSMGINSPQALSITGTAHPRYSLDPDPIFSEGFSDNPLDALFPTSHKRSTHRVRSHSAPAANRLRHSNGDFFAAGTARSWESTSTHPRPRSASVTRAYRGASTATLPGAPAPTSVVSHRRTRAWVPNSPLHATSFYRSQVRNRRSQAHVSPTQRHQQSQQYKSSHSSAHSPRSTSPRSCRQELRAPRKIATTKPPAATHSTPRNTAHTPLSPAHQSSATHLQALSVPSLDSYDHRNRGYSNMSGISTLGPQSPLSPTYGDLPDSLNPDTSYYAALFSPPPPTPAMTNRVAYRPTSHRQPRYLSSPSLAATPPGPSPQSSYFYQHHAPLPPPPPPPVYLIPAPSTTRASRDMHTLSTPSTQSTDINAWWQYIQTLKRQHETQAFELELYGTPK